MKGAAESARRAMWAASSVAVVLVGQLVASRAVRDGFFLSHFESSALPSMMTAASIVSVAGVVGSTRLLRNVAPVRSLPILFFLSAVLHGVEWALSGPAPRAAAITLYLHTMSVGSIVVSGFWSVVNERFDPHVAKQFVGRIGGGASLGGVIGGLAAWLGAATLDVPTMILVIAALNFACAFGVLRIGEGEHPHLAARASGDEVDSSGVFEIFQETPYLRNIAALVTMAAFMQALYDYVFKAEAARLYTSSAELVSFFALFYLGISVATFVVQNLMARRLLDAFGLATTAGTLPGMGLVTGVLGLLFPGLASGIAMRGGTGVVENSLFRSGYELLYTPVLPEKKRPTKTLIDVGGDKLGTAIGGGVAFFVLAIAPTVADGLLVFIGIAASVFGIVLMRRLHQGYIDSLAERLRVGNLDVSEVEVADATTRIAISETMAALDHAVDGVSRSNQVVGATVPGRTELIARTRLEGLDASSVPAPVAEARPFLSPRPRIVAADEVDDLLVAIADLRSRDLSRVGAALALHAPLPRALVGHVIPLLADDAVADVAASALRNIAPGNVGALLDAALSSRTPLPARRRLCDLLGKLPTQRSVDGLVTMLDDRDFELRFRAAAGLLEIHRGAKLEIPRERLFAAALGEALECRRHWRAATALDSRISAPAPHESLAGRRVLQGVTFIVTLLLTVLDPEPLQLAIRALSGGTGADRGTAIEYLENVLPPELLAAVRPLLVDEQLALAQARSRSLILSELVGDPSREPMDLASLRQHIDRQRNG